MILSASVGAGHLRAAEAVEAACRAQYPTATVANFDVLSLMPPAFGTLYRDAYLKMVGRAPQLLGWIYDATDKPFHQDRVRWKLEQAGSARLLRMLREMDPDVAVRTHFLTTALLDRERRKGRSRARIVTVVTDFEVHGFWLGAPSDHYCVATDEARAHLLQLGIAADTITVTGIPTHPVFGERKPRTAMRRKLGLPTGGPPVLLISAGGFGATNVRQMIEQLLAAGVSAQIVTTCGRNAAMKHSIEKLGAPGIHALGFTTEMDEWMSAADVMMGKPGGLTTAASLCKGLGWIVVNPIPGQEERNAIYLLEQGVGVWCNNLHTLGYNVRALLGDPARIAAMQASARRLARPDAASAVAAVVTRQIAG
ncbi:MAG: UDP-N-acetylglucosamine--LPS N-acetylglucosamine transferase [Acidobacteria bacterium]|nr:UDP-N-acetylglucosamine--LPS N-acetylglucosamine transferase [Acidobacteriota bacterium]